MNEQQTFLLPGYVLQTDFMGPLNLSANKLAQHINVPSNRIIDIIRGRRAISPDTARRFSAFFGNSTTFWLDLQRDYDLQISEKEIGPLGIKTAEEIVNTFPAIPDDLECGGDLILKRVGIIWLMDNRGDKVYINFFREKYFSTLYWSIDAGETTFVVAKVQFNRLPQTAGELRLKLRTLTAKGFAPYQLTPNVEFLVSDLHRRVGIHNNRNQLSDDLDRTIADMTPGQIADFRRIFQHIASEIFEAYSETHHYQIHYITHLVHNAMKTFVLAQYVSDYDFIVMDDETESPDQDSFKSILSLKMPEIPRMDFQIHITRDQIQFYRVDSFGLMSLVGEMKRESGWKWGGQYIESETEKRFYAQESLHIVPIGDLRVGDEQIYLQSVEGIIADGNTVTFTTSNYLRTEFTLMEELQARQSQQEFGLTFYDAGGDKTTKFVATVIECSLRKSDTHRVYPSFKLKVKQLMSVMLDFRVFKVSPIFGGIESNYDEVVIAKHNASGKPQSFSFMMAVNFERSTTSSLTEPVPIQCEYRISFDGIPLERKRLVTKIPVRQMSTTKELGLTEVSFNRVAANKKPLPLLIEFVVDGETIASFAWQVSF